MASIIVVLTNEFSEYFCDIFDDIAFEYPFCDIHIYMGSDFKIDIRGNITTNTEKNIYWLIERAKKGDNYGLC